MRTFYFESNLGAEILARNFLKEYKLHDENTPVARILRRSAKKMCDNIFFWRPLMDLCKDFPQLRSYCARRLAKIATTTDRLGYAQRDYCWSAIALNPHFSRRSKIWRQAEFNNRAPCPV